MIIHHPKSARATASGQDQVFGVAEDHEVALITRESMVNLFKTIASSKSYSQLGHHDFPDLNPFMPLAPKTT